MILNKLNGAHFRSVFTLFIVAYILTGTGCFQRAIGGAKFPDRTKIDATRANSVTENGNAANQSLDLNKKGYLGCWSAGNANIMQITDSTIQTRNSHHSLRYEDVTDDIALSRGVRLL